jgi:YfiH family protein
MNFGFSLDDNPQAVAENFRRFCSVFGTDCKNVVLSKQTHTANIRVVTKEDAGKGLFRPLDYTDIDGLVTDCPRLVLVTQYADCTPLAFYDPVKKVVATSHAGWRGTAQEIAARTIQVMINRFGCNAANILCGIGPNIGKCCYEVDDPVINEINKLEYLDTQMCYEVKGGGKYMLDLREVNRQIMVHSGIKPENIDVADLCTCCNSRFFHSHRATGGKRGTLALMISLI